MRPFVPTGGSQLTGFSGGGFLVCRGNYRGRLLRLVGDGLCLLRRAVAVLSFIGTDDFGREVFVDELGTIWKYTEPGAMPRERHDKLYTASSNGRDGEPDLPMSDAFDYKIIN